MSSLAAESRPLGTGLSDLPAENRLDMPVQSLRKWRRRGPIRRGLTPFLVHFERLFVILLTLVLTALGTYEIHGVVSVNAPTWLQILFATLFAITFAWIAFAAASAVLGFFHVMEKRPAAVSKGPTGRNALLMPIYNEDPERVFATLERMGRELHAEGASSAFDIFILSDTQDELRGRRERVHFQDLRRRLEGVIPVYYRRREKNTHRKAGNIADFVTRFGGDYDHMVVLDADSYMKAGTLVALARTMHADPGAGIVQTLPHLWNQRSLYARMQQFAGRIYGRVVAAGLAAWHGRDGNYYGHNAIIRVRAFAESAGLPELSGRKPFGGHVLSHDFIEAALMRRAGWGIYMLPRLEGSYEECPPTLPDLATRDRRWAQGNLQHMKIVPARGLSWVSRVHLIQGIMSYLASPLWFVLILAGLVLSLQAQFVTPQYFPDGLSLFPTWPVFDTERALRLFSVTMAVLFLPKILGVTAAILDTKLRRGSGGATGLVASALVETVLSALIAPIMMLIQSKFVVDIFAGRDSGWKAQNRGDEALSFRAAMKLHAFHMVIGLVLGAAAAAASWVTLMWLSPIVAGLVLSGPLSWFTGRSDLGIRTRERGLFLIPEETAEEDALLAQRAEQAKPALQPAE